MEPVLIIAAVIATLAALLALALKFSTQDGNGAAHPPRVGRTNPEAGPRKLDARDFPRDAA